MISMIVDRCHVAESNRRVIKYVISRLKNQYATFKSISKDERKKFMKDIIQAHKDNIELYNWVNRIR